MDGWMGSMARARDAGEGSGAERFFVYIEYRTGQLHSEIPTFCTYTSVCLGGELGFGTERLGVTMVKLRGLERSLRKTPPPPRGQRNDGLPGLLYRMVGKMWHGASVIGEDIN